MKAMILAAGKGTRLHPVTEDIPKPMIPLVGSRLLDRVISKLAVQGFKDIAINSAHLGNKIMDTYGNGKQLGVDLLHSYEGGTLDGGLLPAPLGSAGGMRQIQQQYHYFDKDFAVVCGDAYFDFDLKGAMAEHRRSGAVATVLVKEMPEETLTNYGVVQYNERGDVQSFQEKPKAGTAHSNMINTGIYLFSPEVFDFIPKTGEYDIGSQLLPDLVAKGVKFIAVEAKGSWLDVGKLQDIHISTQAILRMETDIRPTPLRYRRHIWVDKSAVIDPLRIVFRGELFVDSGAIVEDGAVFDGTCTVARNCVVRKGAILRRTQILGAHLEIPAGLCLENKIVTDSYVISTDGSFVTLSEAGIKDARAISQDSRVQRVG